MQSRSDAPFPSDTQIEHEQHRPCAPDNFDFLRIGAALLVLISHQYALSGLSWKAYFAHPELPAFLRILKVVTIRYFLPGVFEQNVY